MFPRASRFSNLLRGVVIAFATLVLAGASWAAPTRYTLGPDGFGVGRVFTQLGADGAPTAQFSLGDGSLTFNGLSYRASNDRFYAIASDAFGASSLVSFNGSDPASLLTVGALDSGVVGLAYSASDDSFYAAATTPFGESTLLRITTAGVASAINPQGLGFAFMGGLAFDGTSLYGIASDAVGVQRSFNRIDVLTGTATALFDLGDGSVGFNGGLLNTGAGQFEVIGSDLFGDSSLYAFASDDATSLALVGAIGPGYVNAGLAFGAQTALPVPEPSTWALMLVALAGLVARRVPRIRASSR